MQAEEDCSWCVGDLKWTTTLTNIELTTKTFRFFFIFSPILV